VGGQNLDEGVGVGKRGGLGRRDDQDFVGGAGRAGDVSGDAGRNRSGQIDFIVQPGEGADQTFPAEIIRGRPILRHRWPPG
jgi:hypothetical protein